jgi:hypothetical protein
MEPKIISYLDMCSQEKVNLQRGMNFHLGGKYSVILMSVRRNAPYKDVFLNDGTTLIYEGHDAPKIDSSIDPKSIDQPEFTPMGTPTQNGKFYTAAQEAKRGMHHTELVRVYEKIHPGIWADNGYFELIDSWKESDGKRIVFKYKLAATEIDSIDQYEKTSSHQPRRIIPTEVKREVWKRDNGKCVKCGSKDELHFDHIIPYSKGGTSLLAENIQLLCARHNLEKRDIIE